MAGRPGRHHPALHRPGRGRGPQASARGSSRRWSRRSSGTTSGCSPRPTPARPAATCATAGLRRRGGARATGSAGRPTRWDELAQGLGLPDDVADGTPASATSTAAAGSTDVFRGRILFPIFDASGDAVALRRPRACPAPTARSTRTSPETPLYQKSQGALRPELGEGDASSHADRGHRVRGLHRRHRLRPRRPARGGRHLRHRAHRGARAAAAAVRPQSSCWPSTPTPPARPRPSGSTSGSASTRSRSRSPTCPPGVDPADLAGSDPDAAARPRSRAPCRSSASASTGCSAAADLRHRRGPGPGRRGGARRDPRAPERARARPVRDGGRRPLPGRRRAAARRAARPAPPACGAEPTASTRGPPAAPRRESRRPSSRCCASPSTRRPAARPWVCSTTCCSPRTTTSRACRTLRDADGDLHGAPSRPPIPASPTCSARLAVEEHRRRARRRRRAAAHRARPRATLAELRRRGVARPTTRAATATQSRGCSRSVERLQRPERRGRGRRGPVGSLARSNGSREAA